MIHAHHPDWASHIPLLIEALNITEGPVLELGLGISSTPILHMLCLDQNRLLVSYENSPEFVHMFRKYKTNTHIINLIDDWNKAEIDEPYWGVVLVDHKPDERRKEEVKRLVNAKCLVLHDTQPESDDLYKYSEIYPLFKYRKDFTKSKTHATLLSNYHDFSIKID